jgi:hypothetical protein
MSDTNISRAGLLAVLIVGSAAAVVALAVYLNRPTAGGSAQGTAAPPNGTPPATRPGAGKPAVPPVPTALKPPGKIGDEWTHRELFAHLEGKGLKLVTLSIRSGSDHGPVMACCRATGNAERDEDRANWLTVTDGNNTALLPGMATFADMALVQKRPSADDARDQAGLTDGGFAWGRFLFLGDRELLDEIRRRLP